MIFALEELTNKEFYRLTQLFLSKMEYGKAYLEHELEPLFIEAYKEAELEILEDMLEKLAEAGVIRRKVDKNDIALYSGIGMR